jgi:hypothetical protein
MTKRVRQPHVAVTYSLDDPVKDFEISVRAWDRLRTLEEWLARREQTAFAALSHTVPLAEGVHA